MKNKKILIISIQLPFPPSVGAGQYNTLRIAAYLNQMHDVYFASFLKRDDPLNVDGFLEYTGISKYHFEELNIERNPVNLLKSYWHGMSLNLFRNHSEKFGAHIKKIIYDFDTVFVNHYEAFQYVPEDFQGKVVLRVHNAEHIMWRRFSEVNKNPILKLMTRMESNRIEKFEKAYCRRADVVLGTAADSIALEPDANVRAEKYVEFRFLGDDQQIHLPTPEFGELEDAIVYVGVMSWEPNIDGLEWFISDVWPLLKEKKPDLKFYIIGKNPGPRILNLTKDDDSLITTGFVEDLEDYFTQCKVNVIPLRFGSGIKVKTVNALCRGIPVVTTSIGAESLNLKDGRHLFIKDNDQEYAESVIKLIENEIEWRRISRNAREFARAHLTWDSIFQILDEQM